MPDVETTTPVSSLQEAPSTVSLADFMAEGGSVGPTQQSTETVTLDDFLGTSKPQGPNSPEASTFLGYIQDVPVQHKKNFVQKLGDEIYMGALNTAISIGAGMSAGLSDTYSFIGGVTGLNSFQKYREIFVESGRRDQEMAAQAISPRNDFEDVYYGTVNSLWQMVPTLPVDVMTGGATKSAVVGRILPSIERTLMQIPDFALGSGWRGFVRGMEASDNPLDALVNGATQAVEQVTINTMFAKGGPQLKTAAGIAKTGVAKGAAYLTSLVKMGSMGLATAVYEAAKEGRPPTQEEMKSGFSQAAALGLAFMVVPHLTEGTKSPEIRKALSEYQDKIGSVDKTTGEFRIKITDPVEAQKVFEELLGDERIPVKARESLMQPFLDLLDQRGALAPMELRLGTWKDGSKLGLFRETMERNIEQVAGADASQVQFETTDKIAENETFANRWRSKINKLIQGDELVGRGIRPGTKESRLMMRFGEGRMSEAKLQKVAPKNWEQIKKGAEFCRWVYDTTLDAHNAIRAKYGYPLIERLPSYFRHFQEMSLASEMFGILLGEKKVPTEIAGVIDRAKYGKPFTSVEMERTGGKFQKDGVLALQNYVKSVSSQLFHIDSVQRVRMLENIIRGQALANEVAIADGQAVARINLSNFVAKVSEYADYLAGQPSGFTKMVSQYVDRPKIAFIRAMQKNATLNMIAYNVSAATMNLLPLAQGAAVTNPKYFIKGLVTSGLFLQRETPFMLEGVRSGLHDRRYPTGFLPANWHEAWVDKGYILPNVIDRLTVQALLSGKFYEGRAQGLKPETAMLRADMEVARMVQDRSKGQLPLLMTEPDMKLATAFQVEVNNLWSWLAKDVAQDKRTTLKQKIGQLAVFAIAANLMNNIYEKTMGRRPGLDFIEILGTLAGMTKEGENRPFLDRVIPASKQLFGNVPFGNLLIEGGRFPLPSTFPDLNAVLQDPEHKAMSEFLKPTLFWHPFGGGGQARKTVEGLQAWSKGVVETPAGNERYSVHKDFENFIRGFLYGKNAFPEAVQYWSQPVEDR